MNRKTLLLSASALLLALPAIATPVATSFAGDDVINVKAEAAKTVEIFGSLSASDSASYGGSSGMFYRLLVTLAKTTYDKTYQGVVYDVDGASHDITFKNLGGDTSLGTTYHKLDLQFPTTFLNKVIIKKDTVFTQSDDSTDTFSFDKDYLLTFVQNGSPVTIAEYTGSTETVKTIAAFDGNGKTINNEASDKALNSSSSMRYLVYVTQSVTAYSDVYNGNVCDITGKEYSVVLTNLGSSTLDGTGRHKLGVKFTEWTNHFIISKDTRFVKSDDKNTILKFEDDYFVTFEGDGALPVLATKTAVKTEADQFVTNYMHPEIAATDAGSGLCAGETGYYATAKTAYEALSNGAKILFQNDSSYSDMKARYTAWAAANGDNGSKSGIRAVVSDDGTNYVIPTVAALALGLGASAALVLFAKRKKQEK